MVRFQFEKSAETAVFPSSMSNTFFIQRLFRWS